MDKAYVPIKSNNIYSGDTTQDYLKPQVSYLEYLYSKSIRFNYSEYNQNLNAANVIYTVPDNYTLFITSVAIKSSINLVNDFSMIELRINAGVGGYYEPIISMMGSVFGEVSTGHEMHINPVFPIKLNQKETLSKYIISVAQLTGYNFQIIGFLVENRFLLV